MPTYAFLDSSFDDFEVFAIGDFETIQDAANHASVMADEMDMDIEVFEFIFTVQPFTAFDSGSFIDDQEAKELRDQATAKMLAEQNATS